MRQQGSGHIVNMSSTAGLVGFGGSSIYCGKFALEGTSEALAKEVESFGVKVTLIEPGAFRQTLTDALWQQPNNPLMPMLR